MVDLKPLLRWAGSKQRLLPALLARMPTSIDRYYEPFAGSATMFFAAKPTRATLSDINPDLINFYKVLKKSPLETYSRMSEIPRTHESYRAARDAFSTETHSAERAALFWYLNRHCFNGLFRTNRNGKFNVPFGNKLPPIPEWRHVERCTSLLRRASIKHADFEEIIGYAGDGDFVYVDPPYRRASARDRGEYGIGAMADDELSRLIVSVNKASERGAKILMSYNTDLSEHLPDWTHDVVNGRYLISADPRKRIRINEYTAFNYGRPEA